jgi:hypothetical protein
MGRRRFDAVNAAFLTLLLVCLCVVAGGARAHVDTRVNMRVVHFDYDAAGMTAYYRLSLPLLAGTADGRPYIFSRKESGHVFYYADQDRLRADPLGAAQRVAAGHALTMGGQVVAPRLLSAAAHARGDVPPFATVEQARRAAEGPPLARRPGEIEAGDVLLDVALRYPGVRAGDEFELTSTLDVGQASEAPVRNIFASHAGDSVAHYRSDGLLRSPVTINPSILRAVRDFVAAGAAHILEGFDHLLFVVCLVLADPRLRPVALKITGFSVGHSLSLAAGFYGVLPAAAWFAPTVELLIALSVLGSALLMLGRRGGGHGGHAVAGAALTGLVGLIHGCGLAFGLRELLSDSGPNIVPSLLSFNLGVEAGQLLVGAAVWLGFRLAHACSARFGGWLRGGVALAGIALSLAWVVERALPVWNLQYL